MLVENGYIELMIKTGGGLDASGHPLPSGGEWKYPTPCQWRKTEGNLLARSKGEAITRASYSILIHASRFTAEEIRLKDLKGDTIGEFSVIRIEELSRAGMIRLWV